MPGVTDLRRDEPALASARRAAAHHGAVPGQRGVPDTRPAAARARRAGPPRSTWQPPGRPQHDPTLPHLFLTRRTSTTPPRPVDGESSSSPGVGGARPGGVAGQVSRWTDCMSPTPTPCPLVSYDARRRGDRDRHHRDLEAAAHPALPDAAAPTACRSAASARGARGPPPGRYEPRSPARRCRAFAANPVPLELAPWIDPAGGPLLRHAGGGIYTLDVRNVPATGAELRLGTVALTRIADGAVPAPGSGSAAAERRSPSPHRPAAAGQYQSGCAPPTSKPTPRCGRWCRDRASAEWLARRVRPLGRGARRRADATALAGAAGQCSVHDGVDEIVAQPARRRTAEAASAAAQVARAAIAADRTWARLVAPAVTSRARSNGSRCSPPANCDPRLTPGARLPRRHRRPATAHARLPRRGCGAGRWATSPGPASPLARWQLADTGRRRGNRRTPWTRRPRRSRRISRAATSWWVPRLTRPAIVDGRRPRCLHPEPAREMRRRRSRPSTQPGRAKSNWSAQPAPGGAPCCAQPPPRWAARALLIDRARPGCARCAPHDCSTRSRCGSPTAPPEPAPTNAAARLDPCRPRRRPRRPSKRRTSACPPRVRWTPAGDRPQPARAAVGRRAPGHRAPAAVRDWALTPADCARPPRPRRQDPRRRRRRPAPGSVRGAAQSMSPLRLPLRLGRPGLPDRVAPQLRRLGNRVRLRTRGPRRLGVPAA